MKLKCPVIIFFSDHKETRLVDVCVIPKVLGARGGTYFERLSVLQVFVSDRKIDEELGSTQRLHLAAEELMRAIRTFGEGE